MLQLNQITKYYQSKKYKHRILALDNISLSFQEKGLVFILGPSGCGKSTLLNLIGGIDAPTQGEILLNQKPIGTKEKELDYYRNQHIGFVFQDYNLITNITIFDNLSLVCFDMKKEEKIKQIQNVLHQVGLDGYEGRYPTELSGGQMQRIAIARALLKNSEILLADEPTGNLNSEMSIEIFELLKQLSSEKLVIVVSHNEELAKKYAQRIICLKDGKVVSDNHPEEKQENYEINGTKKESKKKLNFKEIWKMASSNLISKKSDTFISTFVLLLSFICVFFSIGFVDYNRMDVNHKNISNMEEEYVWLNSHTYDRNIKLSQVCELTKKHPDLVCIDEPYIESSEDLIKFGFEFYQGYQEITKEGVYIQDTYLKKCLEDPNRFGAICYDYEGQHIIESQKDIDYTKFVGAYYKAESEAVWKLYQCFRIDGVFKSLVDNTKESDSSLESDTRSYYNAIQNRLYYQQDSSYENFNFRCSDFAITKSDNFEFKLNDKKINFTGLDEVSHGSLTFSNELIDSKSSFYDVILYDENYFYYKRDFDAKPEPFTVKNDNEIYLSLHLYNQIFDEIHNQGYYIKKNNYNDGIEIMNYAEHIGEELSFELIDNFLPDYRFKVDKFIFKGLLLRTNDLYSDMPLSARDHLILMSNNNYQKCKDMVRYRVITIRKDSILNLSKFLKDCDQLQMNVRYVQSKFIDEFETSYETTMSIFSLLFILLSIMTFFMNYGFIKRTIKRRSKEIGILRSIGVQKTDVLKIYLYQIFTIAIILILLTLPCSYLSITGINKILTYDYDPNLYLLFYKWWYLPLTIVFIFGISYLSAVFTLIPLGRRRAIDIVRNE